MVKITANTIVKYGMPFIGLALRRVLPYVHQMIVTISVNADDKTKEEIMKIQDPKLEVYWENTTDKSSLTAIENYQIKLSKGDWILTLEDDDIWPKKDLENCISHLEEDIDAIAVNPYQLVDLEHYDTNFGHKYFTKFFRKFGAYWRNPFPQNTIWNNTGILYWKTNPRVKKVPYKYFHLPLLKQYSFRNEPGWAKYKYRKINPAQLPEKYVQEAISISCNSCSQ